jgi:hypothetical protein
MDPNTFNSPSNNQTPVISGQPMPGQMPQNNWQQPMGGTSPSSKKRLLFGMGAGIVALIIVLGGGLWVWTNQAKNKYVQAVPGYEARAKSAHDYFLKLDDRLGHGSDIKKKFDDTIASAPKAPKFLGKSLAPADKAKRVTDITNVLQAFDTHYVSAADIVAYSEKALPIMEQASGSISTPDDLRALKTKLEQARTSLEALKPPAEAKNFQTKMLVAYSLVTADVTASLAAYDAGESDLFAQNVQTLAADVKQISPNSARDELGKLFDTAYTKADNAFGELQKALGVEPATP